MNHKFLINALSKDIFKAYFLASDNELNRLNAKWLIANESPGFPCRVSLVDAQIGERVLVCHFEHLRSDNAYSASGPIFVREKAVTAELEVNQIPSVLHDRLLSLRVYSVVDKMIDASVIEGKDLRSAIQKQLNNSAVEYMHIHNAAPGCYSCSVYRG